METVVGDDFNSKGQFNGSIVATNSLPVQIADPVVYKLVRVEDDGRLVPATDDELIEVEESLEDTRSEWHLTSTRKPAECMPFEDLSFEKLKSEQSGFCKSENAVINAEKFKGHCQESVHLLAPTSNEKDVMCSPSVGQADNGSPASEAFANLHPDFSTLKQDLYLDKLSIRQLHATFQATFGRETTVKDKLWLKRRITMGLINSCDVSTTTFIIKNNKLVKGQRAITSMDNDETEDHRVISEKKLKNSFVESDDKCEELSGEHRASKRIRKPTKRYIEELSDVESWEHNGRLVSAIRNQGHNNSFPSSILKPLGNGNSSERTVVTRLDSFGGSGVHVPYVSCVRRSRPRKNFMAFMKFHPSGMAEPRKNAPVDVYGSQPDDKADEGAFNSRVTSRYFEPLGPSKDMSPREQENFPEHEHSSVSDDNIVTVPTAKGGMRRKHHRAWTLGEVVKLVEGVSRYGAGRWSEIKKLAFASYAYRTTVDLKDKWRNLLRASFAQMPVERRMAVRKHSSTPIPVGIMLRVRELARLHAPRLAAAPDGRRGVHGVSGRPNCEYGLC